MASTDPANALARWDGFVGAALVGPEGLVASWGDLGSPVPLASVSKLVVALAVLVAVEEGSVSLEAAGGPPGATVADLLAHASGLPFEGDVPVAAPRTRRVYSNTGFEQLADHLAAVTAIPWADYVREAVVEPLGMGTTSVAGSPAHGLVAAVADLVTFTGQLLAPTLVAPATLAAATAPHLPDLDGVLPGFGPQRPNPWGLGFEIRGHKSPHWTGAANSPRTFGHFGGSGTFLWVDPDLDLGLVALGTRPFGDWAVELWPALSDAVIAGRRHVT